MVKIEVNPHLRSACALQVPKGYVTFLSLPQEQIWYANELIVSSDLRASLLHLHTGWSWEPPAAQTLPHFTYSTTLKSGCKKLNCALDFQNIEFVSTFLAFWSLWHARWGIERRILYSTSPNFDSYGVFTSLPNTKITAWRSTWKSSNNKAMGEIWYQKE